MNGLDIFLVALAVLAAVGGYRLGFLTRTVSWAGMGIGFFTAARTLPWIAEQFEDGMDSRGLVLVMGMTLMVGAFVGQAIGLLIGSRIRIRLPNHDWRIADHIMGAVAGLVGVIAALWLLLPALAHAPGMLADQTRNSSIARAADRLLPDAPDTMVALRRLVGDPQFPMVFSDMRRAPEVGAAPENPVLAEQVRNAVTPSTVKITGVACSRIQEGSGFVTLGRDVVVTNAHVVAGHEQTQVERSDGARLDATLVVLDTDRDLAVLRVPELDREPLPIGESDVGDTGEVFGHPGGATDTEHSPFRVGQEVQANGTDIYDSHETVREVLVLGSQLAPGDSGAALVEGDGAVIGVAFAIAPDKPDVAYALSTDELVAVLQGNLESPVDSGPCLR